MSINLYSCSVSLIVVPHGNHVILDLTTTAFNCIYISMASLEAQCHMVCNITSLIRQNERPESNQCVIIHHMLMLFYI